MLVDSHCHLDFPDFAGELDAVVPRAPAAGVATMVTIGTRLDQAPRSAPSPRPMTASGARSARTR